jgi:hypothetical protein
VFPRDETANSSHVLEMYESSMAETAHSLLDACSLINTNFVTALLC